MKGEGPDLAWCVGRITAERTRFHYRRRRRLRGYVVEAPSSNRGKKYTPLRRHRRSRSRFRARRAGRGRGAWEEPLRRSHWSWAESGGESEGGHGRRGVSDAGQRPAIVGRWRAPQLSQRGQRSKPELGPQFDIKLQPRPLRCRISFFHRASPLPDRTTHLTTYIRDRD